MKILLDVHDSKFDFIMELLNSLSFVNVEQLSDSKAEFSMEFKSSVEEVVLAKEGKLKLKTADEILNEL